MFKKLEMTCDEATMICDKSQYKESSLFERIKLQIHLLQCKVCAMYSKQNNWLTKVYKNKAKDYQVKSTRLCMSDEEKEKLRRELESFSA